MTDFKTFSRKAAWRWWWWHRRSSLQAYDLFHNIFKESCSSWWWWCGDHGFCQLSLKVVSYLFESSFWVFAGSMVMKKRDHI
jgi:hypothetical protein